MDTPNNAAKPLLNNGDIIGDSASQPLTLTGYVKGVGNLDNVVVTGTLSPGLSPIRQYVGSLVLGDVSTLLMEVGGTQPGAQYDQLVAADALQVDGTLRVALINGYVPAVGDSFTLITVGNGTMAGAFDSMSLPPLPPDRLWDVETSASAVTITVLGQPGRICVTPATSTMMVSSRLSTCSCSSTTSMPTGPGS